MNSLSFNSLISLFNKSICAFNSSFNFVSFFTTFIECLISVILNIFTLGVFTPGIFFGVTE